MLALFSALLQVNNDLKTIGALAGLIAVPGLAVLSLLYFGQAREVRRLREWAGRAPERAAELEQRVSAEAQRRAQGGAATAPATPAARAATAAPAAAPGGNGVAKPAPGAPATAAAAAQAATTAEGEKKDGEKAEEKKDPAATEKQAEGEEATKDGDAAAAGAEEKKDGEGEAKPDGKEDEAAKEAKDKEPVAAAAAGPPTTASPAATPAAATAAATAAARARPPAPPIPPRPAPPPAPPGPPPAPAPAAARARPPAPPIPPRPAQPTRANVPSATIPPRSGGGRRPGAAAGSDGPLAGRISRGALIAIAAAVLVLGITVAIVLKVTGGSDNPTPAASTVAAGPAQQSASSSTPAKPTPVNRAQRAQTNVAVLNGTTVNGLARSVASRLQDQGYTVGNVTDAPNQAQPGTKVEYGPGHHDEAEALATAIKVPASRVVALSPDDSTTAGPNAEVVVVVGQDSAH